MGKNTKELKVVKDCGWGIFILDNGRQYVVNELTVGEYVLESFDDGEDETLVKVETIYESEESDNVVGFIVEV